MAGGSKTPSTTTQTNKQEMSPEQKQVFDLAFPGIKESASTPMEMYSGSGVVNFNNTELAAQNAALTAANSQGKALGNTASAAQQFLLSPDQLSPDSNPWLKAQGDAVTRTTTDNLMENILPQIRSGAQIAGGQYSGGSTREAVAEGIATGKTSAGISDALSRMYGDAYQTGLKTMTTAQANNPTVQAGLMFAPQVAGQIGGQRRAMAQAMKDEEISKFNLKQQLPFLRSQDLLNLMSGMPGGTGVSTVTGAQPKTSGLMSGLGGAATGAGLASTLFPAMAAAGPIGAGLGIIAALAMR